MLLKLQTKLIDNNYCMRTLTQTLLNKLHGPMHYKIGVTCVYNGLVFYTLL